MVARCAKHALRGIEWLLGAEGMQRGMEWLLVTIDLVGDNWEFK